MKPATIPKPEPAECPQNQSRRRFLQGVLLAGAAFAAGCKSEKPNTTAARVFQNRLFPIGSSSLSLKECDEAAQTATFEVSKPGCAGLPDSVTLRVPGSFPASVSRNIDVESISCSTNPQFANVSISAKSAPAENSENQVRPFADLPVIGAAIALLGAVFLWAVHRRGPEGREGILLSPKRQQQNRNHLITP